ncbi:MAG TPA: hypothetical protein PKE04_21370, partial [Clostridia bacterium]|nr:hypothetical protein [Clostridia bacterium]
GRIVITATRTDDALTLVVSDDGVGADVQALAALLEQKDAAHYGAWNIHNRLRLLFGEAYGLAYRRNDRGGIDAVITLRAMNPPPEPGA